MGLADYLRRALFRLTLESARDGHSRQEYVLHESVSALLRVPLGRNQEAAFSRASDVVRLSGGKPTRGVNNRDGGSVLLFGGVGPKVDH